MLSSADVTRLISERSSEARISILQKIIKAYESGHLQTAESYLAEEILELLARDVDVVVRVKLSKALRQNPNIPRSTALTIAYDVAVVSVPFVQVNTSLNEMDLIQLIVSKVPHLQNAVACRSDITETISLRLVKHGTRQVVHTLMSNTTAKINEQTYHAVLRNFGHHEDITHAVATRSLIPLSVASALVDMVSDAVGTRLINQYRLSGRTPLDVSEIITGNAALPYPCDDASEAEVLQIVFALHQQKRLRENLILRALESGDYKFFEAALSVRSGIPFTNVNALVRDRGSNGLLAIYRRAGLSECYYPSVRLNVDLAYGIHPIQSKPEFEIGGALSEHASLDRPDENESLLEPSGWTDLAN